MTGLIRARLLSALCMVVVTLGLAACGGGGSKFRTYDGPPVTSVQVHKADRKMYLISNGTVLRTYNIQLGGNPVGPKQFEGDMRTPEGAYRISHRNPNSQYHLSLGISYPTEAQRAFAAAQGRKPGGDIFIHGTNKDKRRARDWTAGCIAVKNKEMEEIYAMVQPGTPIYIFP